MRGAYEIHIDPRQRECRVVEGVSRRVLRSTPRAVALAILSSVQPQEEEVSGRDVTWTDMLASHGVATGHRGQQHVTLAVLPPKQRTVKYSTRETTERDIVITFPHTLLCMLTERDRFVRGLVYLADPARQANWGVLSTTPVLLPFPYGNIYAESGRICWGTVPHGDIHTITDLENLFFGSGFNHDLFSSLSGMTRLSAVAEGGIPPAILPTSYNFTFVRAIDILLRG